MEVLAAPETLRIVLKCFADKLWESIERQNLGELESNFKEVYYDSVIDLLGLEKKDVLKNDGEEKKEEPVLEKNEIPKAKVFKKPKIPIPFYGHVVENWCYGIKKNHGLYTQCPKPKPNGEIYCKICAKQAMNNASGKPNCGDIRDRKACWSNELTYKPSGMTKEIPYANLMKKLNIDINDANEVTNSLGWGDIPECHLVEKKSRRGRPKTKVVVEDSDDDEPKKRGRPKKKQVAEISDEDLIAQFMAAQ
tara:strand:- start:27 stop:776 length:750 start_codon:yes stop_codon:yes gene_type:complete